MGQPAISISVTESGKRAPEYSLDTDINGAITLADLLKFTKNALLSVASDVLKDEQSRGFDKEPVTLVDGRFNKPLYAVSPLGKIEFVARSDLKEIILNTWDEITKRQKQVTGEYKLRNSVVTYNGREVARDKVALENWLNTNPRFEDRDKIRFVNTAPYARKLERFGITATSSHSRIQRRTNKTKRGTNTVQVPSGAYALAAKSIRRRYKKNSFIKYDLVLGSDLGLTGEGRTYKTGSTKGRTYLYPSILIYTVAKGLQ